MGRILNQGCSLLEFRKQYEGLGKRGHIVADTNVSPFARTRNICFGHQFCARDTKKCF